MITIEYNEKKNTAKVVTAEGRVAYSLTKVKLRDEPCRYALYYIESGCNAIECIAAYPKGTTAVAYCDVIVAADASGNGTVTGGGSYPRGAEVVLKAEACESYKFGGWVDTDGNVIGTSPSITLVADADMRIRAKFVPKSVRTI